jgi:ABC-type arginine transport system permease subunit
MKQQVARFSPHQNGKVLAVLTAVLSLIFVVPLMFLASFAAPKGTAPPTFIFFLVFPIVYLAIGYVSIVVGCAVYNVMFKYIGGIEFEARETAA